VETGPTGRAASQRRRKGLGWPVVRRRSTTPAPRCLVSLHERANGLPLDGEGIQAWLEWEWEATRWRVPVEISRTELEALVEASEVVLERGKHRLVHGEDWRRWGARGGRETLRRYGATGSRLLSLRRRGPDRPRTSSGEGARRRLREAPGRRRVADFAQRLGSLTRGGDWTAPLPLGRVSPLPGP
jgi:hypothetical protein